MKYEEYKTNNKLDLNLCTISKKFKYYTPEPEGKISKYVNQIHSLISIRFSSFVIK